MRKFFYIFAAISLLFISCDDSETAVATSSETRVNTFSFQKDTANLGLTEAIYKIEHLSDTGLIYCVDSLRFGTRLDSVVPYITYKATPASATYFLPDTTVVSTGTDTLDFSKGPIYLLVKSSDLNHKRWYRIDINVHQADPDLYVWRKMTDQIFPSQNCQIKAFYANGLLSLFVNNGFATTIYQSADGASWKTAETPSGLPTPCQVRNILQHGDTLFYATENHLYTSTDLVHWTATDFSSRHFALVNMLVVFDNKSWCILQDRTSQQLFLGTVSGSDILPVESIYGLENGKLPNNFPVSDFAALSFHSSSERPRGMIVGGRTIDGTAVNTRWNLEYELSAGYRMVDFSIEQPSFNTLTGVSIVQYDNRLLMFGGVDNDLEWRSDLLYSDDEGMNWYQPDTASNRLPDTYTSRQNAAVVVDDQQNIYVIGGQSLTSSYSDVYRGYLNQLKWNTLNE